MSKYEIYFRINQIVNKMYFLVGRKFHKYFDNVNLSLNCIIILQLRLESLSISFYGKYF